MYGGFAIFCAAMAITSHVASMQLQKIFGDYQP